MNCIGRGTNKAGGTPHELIQTPRHGPCGCERIPHLPSLTTEMVTTSALDLASFPRVATGLWRATRREQLNWRGRNSRSYRRGVSTRGLSSPHALRLGCRFSGPIGFDWRTPAGRFLDRAKGVPRDARPPVVQLNHFSVTFPCDIRSLATFAVMRRALSRVSSGPIVPSRVHAKFRHNGFHTEVLAQSMLRKVIQAGAIIALLTGAASAQLPKPALHLGGDKPPRTKEQLEYEGAR